MEPKQVTDFRIVIVAIIALAAIEIYALSQGINGKLMAGVFAIIGGLAGLVMPQLKTKS